MFLECLRINLLFTAVIELYNGFGQLVLSQELTASKLIYVGHLVKGVYVYRVIEDYVSSGKIVVE